MKKNDKVVFIIILLSSIALLIYSGAILFNRLQKDYKNIGYQVVNNHINILDILLRNKYIPYDSSIYKTPKKYTALFVLGSMSCRVCIKQYEIYNTLMLQDSNYLDYNQVIAIADMNYDKALWYAKTNPLKMDAFVLMNQGDVKALCNYSEYENYERQLLIIDNKKQKIIGRIKINTGLLFSEYELKKRIPAILQEFNNK